MDKTELKQKAAQLWHDLHISYDSTKKLLIHAEEKLSAMELYPAPLLEHRDALDHLMRYSRIFEETGLCESAVNELANAKQIPLKLNINKNFLCNNDYYSSTIDEACEILKITEREKLKI